MLHAAIKPIFLEESGDVYDAASRGKSDHTMCAKPLHVDLAGVFKLYDDTGVPIHIRDLRSRILIAILVRTKDQTRARTWLQAALWDTTGKDPGGNLRALVHRLRKDLGPHVAHLQTTNSAISLVNVRDATASSAAAGSFFEDIGYTSEGVEDWLREQRTGFEDASPVSSPRSAVAYPAAPTPQHPTVTLRLREVRSIDTRDAVISDWIAGFLSEQLVVSGLVEVIDYDQLEAGQATADMVVDINSADVSGQYVLRVGLIQANNGRVCWTRNLELSNRVIRNFDRAEIADFIATTVHSIERIAGQISEQSTGPRIPLYSIVERILAPEPKVVAAAVSDLEAIGAAHEGPPQAQHLAWLAFGYMLLAGERMTETADDAQDRAWSVLTRAFAIDPTDPLAMSVAAHFESYVNRDFGRAADLLETAHESAPFSPFILDAFAMLRLYSGDLEGGREFARLSADLGRFSPLSSYYEGSRVVAATMGGRHEEATVLGERLLRRRPDFLPVLRHVSASLAELGDVEAARRMVERTQAIDRRFGTPAMYDPNYPLPSEAGREFIIKALKSKGILEGE